MKGKIIIGALAFLAIGITFLIEMDNRKRARQERMEKRWHEIDSILDHTLQNLLEIDTKLKDMNDRTRIINEQNKQIDSLLNSM